MSVARLLALTVILPLGFAACTDGSRATGALDPLVDDRGELRPGHALDDADGLVVTRSRATGRPAMVRAAPGGWLAVDDARQAPVDRARAFLGRYGGALGLDAAARAT